VVDDDPSIHEALTAALGHLYVVHAAATGAEACAILGSQPIAAIILDAILRDEHGLDLVEQFRALAPLPILLLTGHSSEDLAIRALRAKVDDYLKKPPALTELYAALGRLVPRTDGRPPSPLGRAGTSTGTRPGRSGLPRSSTDAA
jgi:DNA-binding response OmpR family regulator